MNAYVSQLVEEQNEAIEAAQPTCIREHEECCGLNTGDSPYRVWFADRANIGHTRSTQDAVEAVAWMEAALADGVGVVTVDWQRGKVWHQEVWVLS